MRDWNVFVISLRGEYEMRGFRILERNLNKLQSSEQVARLAVYKPPT